MKRRRFRLDVTLVLDRLTCRVRGHVPPPYDDTLPPWARPRCVRCNTRIDRPQGSIFKSAGPVAGGAIMYAEEPALARGGIVPRGALVEADFYRPFHPPEGRGRGC